MTESFADVLNLSEFTLYKLSKQIKEKKYFDAVRAIASSGVKTAYLLDPDKKESGFAFFFKGEKAVAYWNFDAGEDYFTLPALIPESKTEEATALANKFLQVNYV